MSDLITRGEAIAILAGEHLHPHGRGRGAYWRWYQRLERERKSGRLAACQEEGRRGYLFGREDVEELAAELASAGVKSTASRARARRALRVRAESQGLVSIPTAAARLGLKPTSLRSRLQRGELEGQRIDGQWFLTEDAVAAARPRTRAKEATVTVECALCGRPRRKTASQARASELHFCCDEHRLEWLTAEAKAGRVTRRGAPDGPAGRRRKSEVMSLQWAEGLRDREQISALGRGAAWTRGLKAAERIDKMTRTRYGHGLTDEQKRRIASAAMSRATRASARSRQTREYEARLRELWTSDSTVAQIAEELGTTVDNVKKMRARLGLPPRSPGRRRREMVTNLSCAV